MEIIEKSSLEQQIKVSMDENIELTRELLLLTRKIHRYMRFSQITAIVQLVIIVAPLILGAVFLPTLMKGISELTGNLPMQLLQQEGAKSDSTLNQIPTGFDLNSLIKQYQQSQQQQ
jgi:predicted PurR-regulated permease PerM